MRAMEHSNGAAGDRLIYQRDRTDWSDYVEKSSALSAEQINRWRADLQPDVGALWDDPRELDAEVAIQYGMLTGISPFSNAALALEKLVRQLAN